MEITVDILEDMVKRLNSLQSDLPQILALGLRELQSELALGFSGLSEILEFLVSLPSPQEVLDLRLSATLQEELDDLLEKNRTTGLTPLEQRVWRQYEFVEHLVRMAKAQALLKLTAAA